MCAREDIGSRLFRFAQAARASLGFEMSSLLRRVSISRLLLACATLIAAGIAGTALAAAVGNDPRPAPKPLAQAVHDALSAPKVAGVSASVKLVNRLVEGASLQGGQAASNPLLSGGSGRVWLSSDGRARLELQSDQGAIQILYDGSSVTLYDAATNQLYSYTPPATSGSGGGGSTGGSMSGSDGSSQPDAAGPPSVAKIEEAITKLMGHVDLSGATPTDVGGQPAYAVRISPRGNGGLVGGAELAWDADHGVPLKLAVYAKGDPKPVLELAATDISYGPVPDSVFSLSLPSGVKRTQIGPASASSSPGGEGTGGARPQIDASVTGLAAVQAKLPFTVQAPSTLAGMSRHEVRLIRSGGHDAALVCYGEGLGGIVVVESAATEGKAGASEGPSESSTGPGLPQVSIDGAKAAELPTALGTLLRFQSGGIDHVLAGSVTPSVLQAAARGL